MAGYSNILSSQVEQLQPMDLTQSKRDLLLSLMGNIASQQDSISNLTTESQTLLNDLDSRVKAIAGASDVSLEDINNTIDLIVKLQSEDDAGSTILSALGQVFAQLNTRETSHTFERTCTTSNGLLDIDLSAYAFANMNDYSIQVSAQGLEPVTTNVQKVSSTLARISVRDHEKWEFDESEVGLKDCSKEAINLTITVFRMPEKITATFTEVDGDVRTIGDGAGVISPPDAPTANLDYGDDVMVSGLTTEGMTVRITYPDGHIDEQVGQPAPNAGFYVSTRSSANLMEDGNITVVAVDVVNNLISPAVILEYIVPNQGGNEGGGNAL